MGFVLKYSKILVKLLFTLTVLCAVYTFYKNGTHRSRRHVIFRKPKLEGRSDLKYILMWSTQEEEWANLKIGQTEFIDRSCACQNCYFTHDKNLLNGDYTNFDAILINAKAASRHNQANQDFPIKRKPRQIYILATQESAANYPICDEKFDNYFNLTWSYKLNSDVVWSYFSIYNSDNERVGPKIGMQWIRSPDPVHDSIKAVVAQKDFTAAMFASNCNTKSKRESLVTLLKYEMKKYNLSLEVVGTCGSRECPTSKEEECEAILERYYFYFAFENSLSEDYVSEKIIKAISTYSLPVVYGGANYSRFLPPHSYIELGSLGVKKTASKISDLLKNKTEYLEYFRWHNEYSYELHHYGVPGTESLCKLCEVMNTNVNKVYMNFREWWLSNYEDACRHKILVCQRVTREKAKGKGKLSFVVTRS